jgi:hypothetical protein
MYRFTIAAEISPTPHASRPYACLLRHRRRSAASGTGHERGQAIRQGVQSGAETVSLLLTGAIIRAPAI